MSNIKEIFAYQDKEELSLAAAEKLVGVSEAAISDHGAFVIALAGGSTPKRLYEILASDSFNKKMDWSKWHVFIGDERLVPSDHHDSNFCMAKETLLSKVPIPEANIYPIDTSNDVLAAPRYEYVMREIFEKLKINGLDVVLLGLGSDGHTLSLFPGKEAVLERDKWVIKTKCGVLPPQVDRITITLPIVLASKIALFLVAGSDKAEVTKRILEHEPNIHIPASLVIPNDILSVCWMLDQAAAANLENY